jgi:type I restriction enzyme, S subunit
MAGDWRSIRLGSLTEFLSGGTPSKDRQDYWGGSIPWVSAKDMKRFRLDDTEDHLTESGISNGSRLVPAGTVFLLARGMTLLNDIPICVANRPMSFNQDVKALRPNQQIHQEFLPYLLVGNKERLLSLVDLAGHGTGRLNSDELRALDVLLPPLAEQRAIGRILSALDDKIELNRRMNETLEAMARALFRSWFVDFDPVRAEAEGCDPGLPRPIADLFPARFVGSEIGATPEGWEVGIFESAAELIRTQANPFETPDRVFSYYSIPAFDDGQMPLTETGTTIKSMKFSVPTGTVLFSKLNPTIERVWLVDPQPNESAVCSTEFLVLRPKAPFGRCFLYCLSRAPNFREAVNSLVTGTSNSHQRARADGILEMPIALPPAGLAERFEDLAGPLLDRTLANRRQSQTLTKAREALLPKLISGELRVNDVRCFVKDIN